MTFFSIITEFKNYRALLKSSPQMILNRISLLLIEIIEEYQVIGRIFPLIIALIIFGIVFLLTLCFGLAYALYFYGHLSILQTIVFHLIFLAIILFFIIKKINNILKNKSDFLCDTLYELEQDREMLSQLNS